MNVLISAFGYFVSLDKERGCHYLRVLDELRKTVQYSGINERAVLAVLDRLETDSDVMRTADKSYLPVIV